MSLDSLWRILKSRLLSTAIGLLLAAVSVFGLWAGGQIPTRFITSLFTDTDPTPPHRQALQVCADTAEQKAGVTRPTSIAISGNKADEALRKVDENTYRAQATLFIEVPPNQPSKSVPFICKAKQQKNDDWKVLSLKQPDNLTN